MKTLLPLFLVILLVSSSFKPEHPVVIKLHGDVNLGEIKQTAAGTTYESDGSITVTGKIDDHARVFLKAAKNIYIQSSIDQHCSVTMYAGQLIDIHEKIDQHCRVECFVGSGGKISVGQKIDQHSSAWFSVPNGTIVIHEAVDQHSKLHYNCKNLNAGRVVEGSTTIKESSISEQGYYRMDAPGDEDLD